MLRSNDVENRIGLHLGIIKNGVNPIYTSESAKRWWNYLINDPRKYIGSLLANDTGKYIDFICYGNEVALYVINRRIVGRPGDQVYAVLTIPINIKVESKDLVELINKVKEIYIPSGGNLSDIKESADKDFTKQYELKETMIDSCSCSIDNEKYAYQLYKDKNDYFLLEDLLDKNLFSSCYGYYKAVFLLNKEDNIQIQPEIKELRQKDVDEFVLLKYPDLGKEYKLSIDDEVFKVPGYPTTFNKKIEIKVERDNYIPTYISINTGDKKYYDPTDEIKRLKLDRYVKLKRSDFVIKDNEDNIVKDPITIEVGSSDIPKCTIPLKDVCVCKESELLDGGELTIKCEGYNDATINVSDLKVGWDDKEGCWRLKNGIQLKLNRITSEYKYVIKKDGDTSSNIEFVIKSDDNNYKVKNSPLKGYNIISINNNRDILLEYDNNNNVAKLHIVIAIVASLLVGIVGGFFIGRIGNKDNVNNIKELEQSNRNLQSEIESLEKILPSLLVNATVWDEDAFETAGYGELYDALKDMDLGKVEEYSEKIKPQSGSQWNDIITQCKELKDKGIKASRSYSVSQGIDIERWISYINKHNISNLVNNQKWYRQEFNDADYVGLYDALNTFNFAEVIEYSNNLGIKNLKQGDPWNDIIFICKKYKGKSIPLDSYSKDGSITITKWIEFVKKKLNTNSAKPSQEQGKNVGNQSRSHNTDSIGTRGKRRI